MANLTEASDARLVMSTARYGQDALRETYRRYTGAVHGLARGMPGEPPIVTALG